jgi:hypothetical protein
MLFTFIAFALIVVASSTTRCSLSDNCCTAGSNCPACTAAKSGSQRVRKDVRTLTTAEFDSFANAVNVMKSTSFSNGQLKYGSAFKTYDYFVAKHLAASYDNRGIIYLFFISRNYIYHSQVTKGILVLDL